MKERFWLKHLDLYHAFCQWANRFDYLPYRERFEEGTPKSFVMASMTVNDLIIVRIEEYNMTKEVKSQSFDDIDLAIEWLKSDKTGKPFDDYWSEETN